MTLESGVLAVVAKGRLTLDYGVLAVGAKGRLAPLVAVTDFNFPRCATFAPPPRAGWRGVCANGRMGLLQHVCEGCGSANSAEIMVRVRAGDAGGRGEGDWESKLSHNLLHNAPLGNNLLSNPMHQRELERRHFLLLMLPQPGLAQRFCYVRALPIHRPLINRQRLFLLCLPPCCESGWGPPDS